MVGLAGSALQGRWLSVLSACCAQGALEVLPGSMSLKIKPEVRSVGERARGGALEGRGCWVWGPAQLLLPPPTL